MNPSWTDITQTLVRAALAEDLGDAGDLTSTLLEDDAPVRGRVVARQDGVVAGLALAPLICAEFARYVEQALHPQAGIRRVVQAGRAPTFGPARRGAACFADGDDVSAGATVAVLAGPRPAVLALERTLLNFLGRMSGVATLTQRFVRAARTGSASAQIIDTRKTLPGWRELDRYSVRCGGGQNHRAGLYDAILVKDNHLAGVPTERLAGTLFEMLNRAGAQRPAPRFVEVEVDNLAHLDEVFKVVGIDVVLLDNFATPALAQAVRRRDSAGLRGKVQLEASGGVTLETVAAIAATGVERIAVGALTHAAASLDIALDLDA